MPTYALVLFGAAALTALVSALSLLAKSEAIRGGGRVIGGLSWILVGAFLLALTFGTPGLPSPCGLLSGCLVFTGVVTVASGLRKYLRRNVTA